MLYWNHGKAQTSHMHYYLKGCGPSIAGVWFNLLRPDYESPIIIQSQYPSLPIPSSYKYTELYNYTYINTYNSAIISISPPNCQKNTPTCNSAKAKVFSFSQSKKQPTRNTNSNLNLKTKKMRGENLTIEGF